MPFSPCKFTSLGAGILFGFEDYSVRGLGVAKIIAPSPSYLPAGGVIGTRIGMSIAYVALIVSFTVWVIDDVFRQIPPELTEASEIDSGTRGQAFWRVEYPVARSGIASEGVFAFLTSRNEYALASQSDPLHDVEDETCRPSRFHLGNYSSIGGGGARFRCGGLSPRLSSRSSSRNTS